jgi:hypothetical protein
VSISDQMKTGTARNGAGKIFVAYVAMILCAVLVACGGGSNSGGGSSDSGGGGSGSGGGGGGSGGGGSGGGGGGSQPTHTVGGTVSGLAGSGLVLRNSGGDDLHVSADGAFAFATAVTSGTAYAVTIAAQPTLPTQNCTVVHDSGTVGTANVIDVAVSCVSVPLTLTSSVPASGASDVARATNFVLTFSAPLDASKVTTANVSLQGPSGAVAATVSASTNVLTVTPTSQLSPSASYTLTVSTAVMGTGGEALSSPVTLNFATASIPWTTLIGRTVTMPATTEGFKCTRIGVPSDLYITGFRSVAKSAVRALVTVSSSSTVTGDYDCSAGSLDNTLIYAASVGTDDFTFPPGFGIHVRAGQFLNLNLHIVNEGVDAVTESDQILIQAGIDADIATAAEMVMLGTFQINVPNDGQLHTAAGDFHPATDQQLLALLPLMQSYGKHQKVSRVASSGTDTILDVDFDPTKQIFHPLSQVFLHAGDTVYTVCSYINTGSRTANYGEAWADNENCFSAMYLAPSAGQTLFSGVHP